MPERNLSLIVSAAADAAAVNALLEGMALQSYETFISCLRSLRLAVLQSSIRQIELRRFKPTFVC
jgi:hypothetical protein